MSDTAQDLERVEAEFKELAAKRYRLRAERAKEEQAALEEKLAEYDFAITSGRVGDGTRLIASHPVYGQIYSRDPERLVIQARSKAEAAARLKPAEPAKPAPRRDESRDGAPIADYADAPPRKVQIARPGK